GKVKPEPAEDEALTRAGVMDATSRKLAAWRRSMLFVAAVPCAFAALFGLIDVIAMDKKSKEFYSAFGLLLFYVRALAVFALPPAVSRACIRLKLLLPESLVPGWGLVASTPLFVLLTLSTFVLLYHIAGNALLLLGLLLWIGAPLLYLSKFNLLTRPVTES